MSDLKLARIVRLDTSDDQVFSRAAPAGEWAISGGFEFSNWEEADLVGKSRQAFSNGWLGLGGFGRATFVAVSRITPAELDALKQRLAQHFVTIYGAPSTAAALPVAVQELDQMRDLVAEHDLNTLLVVSRSLTSAGVREQFRAIAPRDAEIEQIAIHDT